MGEKRESQRTPESNYNEGRSVQGESVLNAAHTMKISYNDHQVQFYSDLATGIGIWQQLCDLGVWHGLI